MTATATACPLCHVDARDSAGDVKHEPWCAHFLRGPDMGGDPAEWPTLFQQPLEASNEREVAPWTA
jgi:hypothetical protein